MVAVAEVGVVWFSRKISVNGSGHTAVEGFEVQLWMHNREISLLREDINTTTVS